MDPWWTVILVALCLVWIGEAALMIRDVDPPRANARKHLVTWRRIRWLSAALLIAIAVHVRTDSGQSGYLGTGFLLLALVEFFFACKRWRQTPSGSPERKQVIDPAVFGVAWLVIGALYFVG
jgi:hypothetical protein